MPKTIIQLLLVAALGLCTAGEGYPVDAEAADDPCELQPVSLKSRAAHEHPVAPQLAGTLPPRPVPILSWHCGTPEPPPSDIVVATVGPDTPRPRAPPRAASPVTP